MVVVLGQRVVLPLDTAGRPHDAQGALALPGLVAGPALRAAGVGDALGAVLALPARVADALVRDRSIVGAKTVIHAAA